MPIPRINYIVNSEGKNSLIPIPSVETQIYLQEVQSADSLKCRFAKVQIC